MSNITSDEHLVFLISCINHSNNRKVDFAEVAKECNIVTAGAAAKRYSRLLKSVEASKGGASPSKKTSDNDACAASPKKKGAGAKRKVSTAKETPIKKAKAMKKAAVALAEDLVEKKFAPVKEEEDEDSELSDGAVSNEDDEDVKEEIKEDEE